MSSHEIPPPMTKLGHRSLYHPHNLLQPKPQPSPYFEVHYPNPINGSKLHLQSYESKFVVSRLPQRRNYIIAYTFPSFFANKPC